MEGCKTMAETEMIRNNVGMETITSMSREMRMSTGTEIFLPRTGMKAKGIAKRFPIIREVIKIKTENKTCNENFPKETESASVISYERAINPQNMPRKKKIIFSTAAAREIFKRSSPKYPAM